MTGSLARWMCALLSMGAGSCSDGPHVIGSLRGDRLCADAAPDALFCSNFESSSLSSEWDVVTENRGALERTAERAYSGEAALHAATTGARSVAVVATRFPGVRGGELFFAARVFVPAGLPTETINIFFLGEGSESEPFVDFNLEGGAVQLFVPQATPSHRTGELQVPRDRWFCYQARTAIDKSQGAVSVTVDGQLALAVEGIDTQPPGGLSEFRAGIDWSSSQDAFFEVYIDDVAIDTQPLSCL